MEDIKWDGRFVHNQNNGVSMNVLKLQCRKLAPVRVNFLL